MSADTVISLPVAAVSPPDAAISEPADSGGPARLRKLLAILRRCFGFAALILLLAVLATIPVVQLLSLGYLLEVSGRVARRGRLREGFFGLEKAALAGGVLLGLWLLAWPLRLAASLWSSALLIDPASPAARAWRWVLIGLTVLAGLHALGACFRGGRLRHFLLPRPLVELRLIFNRRSLVAARDGLWNFVVALRLPYYFWLGARGFAGAFLWLVVPVSLLAVASRLPQPGGALVGIVGGALFVFVLLHLPLLQGAFAAENRWGAMFEVRRNRQRFARAPLAYALALLGTLVLAIPLFVFKIELIPQEAAWLPSLLFVLSGLPARLLSGWALARSQRRDTNRHWLWRWSSRLALLPVAAIYSFLVYLTQYTSWYGVWSLYEQHPFLVPVPFLNL